MNPVSQTAVSIVGELAETHPCFIALPDRPVCGPSQLATTTPPEPGLGFPCDPDAEVPRDAIGPYAGSDAGRPKPALARLFRP